MNDSAGKPLSVGQKVTFTEPGKDGKAWHGTVEMLVPSGSTHPRGGGPALVSGRSYPSADQLTPERQAEFKSIGHADAFGKTIGDSGVVGHDLVIATIDPDLADAQKVMCDHDLSEPCAGFATTSDQNDCACPSRMWVPAALVVGE